MGICSKEYYKKLYDDNEELGNLRYELEKAFRNIYDESLNPKGGNISLESYNLLKKGFESVTDGLEMMRKSGQVLDLKYQYKL